MITTQNTPISCYVYSSIRVFSSCVFRDCYTLCICGIQDLRYSQQSLIGPCTCISNMLWMQCLLFRAPSFHLNGTLSTRRLSLSTWYLPWQLLYYHFQGEGGFSQIIKGGWITISSCTLIWGFHCRVTHIISQCLFRVPTHRRALARPISLSCLDQYWMKLQQEQLS